jgi:hypothetical protein
MSGFVSAVVFASVASVSAQAPKNVLRVQSSPQVRIITAPDGLVTAVIGGQNANRGLGDFVFCMSHDKPLASPINWSGPATVIYEAAGQMQIPGFEPAPETLGAGSGVAVLPEAGSGWLFESPGTKAPLRPEDQAKAAKATKIVTRSIRMAPTRPARQVRLSFCDPLVAGH